MNLTRLTHQISTILIGRTVRLFALRFMLLLSGLRLVPCFCPLDEGLLIIFLAVKPLENAIELDPIFLEDNRDVDNIFFVDGVVELHVLLRLHPHAALALVESDVAVAVEVYRIPPLHHMVVEVTELLPHLVYLSVIIPLLLLKGKLSVGVVEVLQAANQRLLRQVQPQLHVYLLLEVVDARIGSYLQHSLYRVVEHLSLTVNRLVVELDLRGLGT